MKFVFASYVFSPEFNRPQDWLKRIGAYIGVLESLSKQHTITSIEQIDYEGAYQQKGVQYYFMRFGKRRLYFPWRLHRFIKKLQPDVVLVHGMDFPLQVIQLKRSLGPGVKIIVQSHGKNTPRGYKKILQRIADRSIDAYFFTSKTMGAAWVNTGLVADEKKVHEIMVGSSLFQMTDKKTARSKLGVQEGPAFLWAGRLDQNKDPLTVVKAFLSFASFSPTARLYMIYQSEELLPAIQQLINSDHYGNSIHLIGRIAHDAMQDWLNSADFFISGSHFEVFGVALSEAMSCGCIPIVTNIPSFQKITGDGACGWMYEAGNVEALLEVLKKTATIDMSLERDKAVHQFEHHLSFDAIAEEIQEVVNSL